MDELLTSLEVARILRVSGDTVRRWRREDTGPTYILVGGLIRYHRDDVDAWLEANTITPEEGR